MSVVCAVALVSLVAVEVWAAEPQAGVGVRAQSRSVGLPWNGRLAGGVKLLQSDTIRYLPDRAAKDLFWGTSALVGMLQRASAAVALRWPGSKLSVGDLSAREGGWIQGHHSHRSGRDADLAFFMRDALGGVQRYWSFVSFDRNGIASDAPSHLRFDDARNWAVVASLLSDPEARVQYIFVSASIRTRLLMEGRRRGESSEFLRAAAAVLVEPRRGHVHNDHFHVRIYCARGERPECTDTEPYWPWYDGEPPDGRYAELPTIHWGKPAPAKPTASVVVREKGKRPDPLRSAPHAERTQAVRP